MVCKGVDLLAWTFQIIPVINADHLDSRSQYKMGGLLWHWFVCLNDTALVLFGKLIFNKWCTHFLHNSLLTSSLEVKVVDKATFLPCEWTNVTWWPMFINLLFALLKKWRVQSIWVTKYFKLSQVILNCAIYCNSSIVITNKSSMIWEAGEKMGSLNCWYCMWVSVLA